MKKSLLVFAFFFCCVLSVPAWAQGGNVVGVGVKAGAASEAVSFGALYNPYNNLSITSNSESGKFFVNPITAGYAPLTNQFIPAEKGLNVIDPNLLTEWWLYHVSMTYQQASNLADSELVTDGKFDVWKVSKSNVLPLDASKKILLVPGELNLNDLLHEVGIKEYNSHEPEVVNTKDEKTNTLQAIGKTVKGAIENDANVLVLFARVKGSEVKNATNAFGADGGASFLNHLTGLFFNLSGSRTMGSTSTFIVESIQAQPLKVALSEEQYKALKNKVENWILAQQRFSSEVKNAEAEIAYLEQKLRKADVLSKLEKLKTGGEAVVAPAPVPEKKGKKGKGLTTATKAKGAKVINGK